jgi:nucleoside-diphosphate-sugar epimerase
MRVAVTGATGLIGPRLVKSLQARGDEVTILSRNPERAHRTLPGVEAVRWDPASEVDQGREAGDPGESRGWHERARARNGVVAGGGAPGRSC